MNTKKIKRYFIVFFAISFLFHLSFVFINLGILRTTPTKIVKQHEKEKRIYLKFREDATRKQIVNTTQSESKKPLKESFLGKTDQAVERETVSKNVDSFKESGFGNKNGFNVAMENNKPKGKKPKQKEEVNKSKESKEVSLSDLSYTKSDSGQTTLSALGLQNGNKALQGVGSNNDYIEEIPLGDMTQLNTTEYKYYGFFYRIRQKLEQHWGKSLKEKTSKLYKSGRQLAANQDKITALQVVLNSEGKIVNVIVKGTSGVTELDEAAIESFQKAGPFPNPPAGLLVDGEALIEWGFVVKS